MMTLRTPPGTTHVLAQCRDCAWSVDDYRTAQADALSHAKATGHTVAVERAQSWTYNPKPGLEIDRKRRKGRCPDCGSTNTAANPARCLDCGFGP